jgi:hypothetical protein
VAATAALFAAVALAALLFVDTAFAQSRRPVPRSYRPVNPYSYSNAQRPRFSPEEQRIIDQITQTDRATGY